MELIVGMSLMGIFMAMFTGAVVLMTSTANKVQAVTTSSGQVNQAFLKLDELVRYASMISTPGKATGGTGDWYVELSLPGLGGVANCTQLRDDVASQQLQQRTWTVTTSGTTSSASPASAWQPLASAITNTLTDTPAPFVPIQTKGSLFQQLQINLTSSSTRPASATSKTSLVFTAMNSTVGAPATCQNWGRP